MSLVSSVPNRTLIFCYSYWVPDWVTGGDGPRLQKQIWSELVTRLEAVQPGCLSMIK